MESQPQGPEDARNIADEYPSPEREHLALTEQVLTSGNPNTTEIEQTEPLASTSNVGLSDEHDHAPVQEDVDMQTELANQVAAQAIEAAAAAEARAASETTISGPSSAQASIEAKANPTSRRPPQQSQPQTIHNPRQPTFPRSRPSGPFSTPSSTAAGPSKLTAPAPQLTPNEQIAVLREAYARNPNPGKTELKVLAEKTGRPWNRIREYFRQRRNKLRGLDDLENMEEPGRATGWLQVTYRAGGPSSHVTQLSMYNTYRSRFDPYSANTPLLGGQDLIQLACATFPGCEMARDGGEYVLKGLGEKEKEVQAEEAEAWEKGMEGLMEPLRAGSWLLSSFQHQTDSSATSTLTQTDLYTSYAARFSSLLTEAPTPEQDGAAAGADRQARNDEFSAVDLVNAPDVTAEDVASEGDTPTLTEDQHRSLAEISLLAPNDPHESGDMDGNGNNDDSGNIDDVSTPPPVSGTGIKRENRLLNPIELINLARMTFPKCQPMVDEEGRFIIRGLERREGIAPGHSGRVGEMYPFTLMAEKQPGEAFVSLMKRKLEALSPEEREGEVNKKRGKLNANDVVDVNVDVDGAENDGQIEKELTEEDKELIAGLKRFRGSKLGQQVRDVCVSQ